MFDLQHGFWVAFATLTVVRSNLRATGRNAGQAIAGTIAGVAVAAPIIASAKPSAGWYLALLPAVIALAIYANVAIGFVVGQAGFTLAIIALFNLLVPAGWRIGLVRIFDVVPPTPSADAADGGTADLAGWLEDLATEAGAA